MKPALDAFLARVDLSRFPIPLRLSTSPGAPGLVLRVAFQVRERDGDAMVWINDAKVVVAACSDLQCLAEVRQLLHRTITHELDECLRVDGQRAFDPHAKGSAAVLMREQRP